MNKLVEASFAGVTAEGGVKTTESKYFGGETRLEGTEGPQTVFIGFGTTNTQSSAELSTLAAYLSTTPSIKWAKGLSPVAQNIPEGTSVQPVFLQYSDASLFGLLVQADGVQGVKDAGKVVVDAIKKAAKGGLSEEEVKGAVRRAKFSAASGIETRDGLVNVLGSKVSSVRFFG